MLIEERIIASFLLRAQQELQATAFAHAGSLALGSRVPARLVRQQLLQAGLNELLSSTNNLSLAGKVTIANWLLPLGELDNLLVEPVAPAEPEAGASLTLDHLAPRLRRAPTDIPFTDTLTVAGQISGSLPAGTELLLYRDGQLLRRQPATLGVFSYLDSSPGSVYLAELTGLGLSSIRVRALVSPVLYGTGPHGLDNNGRLDLTAVYPAFTGTVGRFSFSAQRTRIYLLVPVALGTVSTLTQPNDNNADITPTFTQAPVLVDFGPDGQAAYVEIENDRNYIGAFTLDAHLVSTAIIP